MAEFLEERIIGDIQYGSSWEDDYSVNITTTSGGQEYRSLNHPFPIRKFDVTYMMDNINMWISLVNTYHRAHGKYAGFRARCIDEYTSNANGTTPATAVDQVLTLTSGLSYQLRKYYGTDKAAGATGYSYRTIYKPVAGTVLVAIGTIPIRSADYSVNTATGIVTFAANKSITITNITKATSAVISTTNTAGIVAGQMVHISGVLGMTQINLWRVEVLSVSVNTSITVNANTLSMGNYTSGGVCNTNPQSGEQVTAGFEFDFPVRFNSNLPVGQNKPMYRDITNIELMELINP